MKVNVEVECTPEEMRRLMGLPDMTPVHDRYIAMVTDMMDAGSVKPELLETMMKNWAPMGDAGMTFWRRLLESGIKSG